MRGSREANQKTLALFKTANATVRVDSAPNSGRGDQIGRARREALAIPLESGAPFILYCDGDRILHWIENYPAELAQVLTRIPEHDFTVLGRTTRAFDTHPRNQRDTEAIVNHIFHLKTGCAWDLMAGARGLSRRAAQAIVAGSQDDEISVDVTWPLYLRSLGDYSLGYIATEGLEFETQDRYPHAIAAAGSHQAWIKTLDTNIDIWLHRLEYARLDLEAMRPFD